MEIKDLALAVEKGKTKDVKALVNEALEEGHSVSEILNDGLIAPLGVVGDKFSRNEIFVPEMLIAARAMSAGVKIIEPLMKDSGVKALGTVLIGTVKGDLHDIGKNLCTMMLSGIGADVHDLGVDVPDAKFVEEAERINADIVCLSALLTTTMPAIGDVVEEFKKSGTRDKYYIMIGGAPVSQKFADEIGADAYTVDASECSKVAKAYLEKKYAKGA